MGIYFAGAVEWLGTILAAAQGKVLLLRLGRGELGHSLGALRHSVLGELTREHEAN